MKSCSMGDEIYAPLHSIETLAALDGPGIRTAVFLQGCPLSCLYCHNPDMIPLSGGEDVLPGELYKRIERYASYWGERGGVTFTGGEPLLHAGFILRFMDECPHVRVVIDTCGHVFNGETREVIRKAQQVLLDIKHTDGAAFKSLCGVSINNTLKTLDYIKRIGVNAVIRQVIIPGYTDNAGNVRELSRLADGLRVELLPFHKLGEEKWRRCGRVYTLYDTPEPTEEKMEELRACLR